MELLLIYKTSTLIDARTVNEIIGPFPTVKEAIDYYAMHPEYYDDPDVTWAVRSLTAPVGSEIPADAGLTPRMCPHHFDCDGGCGYLYSKEDEGIGRFVRYLYTKVIINGEDAVVEFFKQHVTLKDVKQWQR